MSEQDSEPINEEPQKIEEESEYSTAQNEEMNVSNDDPVTQESETMSSPENEETTDEPESEKVESGNEADNEQPAETVSEDPVEEPKKKKTRSHRPKK